MTKKMKNIWDMTNMILWKWDSMILWSMSINPIIFSVHSPWQYHSIAKAGVWLRLLPWALQDTTVEAILNRWRKRSVCLCSPALPVPLTCAGRATLRWWANTPGFWAWGVLEGGGPWGLLQTCGTVAEQSRSPPGWQPPPHSHLSLSTCNPLSHAIALSNIFCTPQ